MAKSTKSKSALDLFDRLTKAYDHMRKLHAKHIGAYKLTTPQFGVLDVLNNTGPIPLKKISDELMVTGANITCVVDNLEKEDLVKRVPSKQDRRVINAELTSKGKQKLDTIYPGHVKNIQEFTGKLNETEAKQLLDLLEKLVS